MYIIIYHITISHKEKYDDTFYNNQHVLYNMTFSSLYLPLRCHSQPTNRLKIVQKSETQRDVIIMGRYCT